MTRRLGFRRMTIGSLLLLVVGLLGIGLATGGTGRAPTEAAPSGGRVVGQSAAPTTLLCPPDKVQVSYRWRTPDSAQAAVDRTLRDRGYQPQVATGDVGRGSLVIIWGDAVVPSSTEIGASPTGARTITVNPKARDAERALTSAVQKVAPGCTRAAEGTLKSQPSARVGPVAPGGAQRLAGGPAASGQSERPDEGTRRLVAVLAAALASWWVMGLQPVAEARQGWTAMRRWLRRDGLQQRVATLDDDEEYEEVRA